MSTLDFSFEDTAWEQYLSQADQGSNLSALRFLALLEQEDEDTLEDAFQDLLSNAITLDLSALPQENGSGEAALRLRREAELVQNGLLLQSLEENDPLRLYLEELASIPAFGDVGLLAQQLQQDPSEIIRNQLVNLSLSRVVELAAEFTGRGVLLLDLIQEGSLGLWQAIAQFVDGDFEAHRDWYIRQYMAKAVILQARASGLGQKMRQAMEDYRSVDERLLAELGRNPTLEEIAEGMHVSVEEAELTAQMVESARSLNRAKLEAEEPEEDPEDNQAVEDTAYFQMRQRIEELLSALSEPEAKLLSLRFGLEGGLPLSPEETGKRLGLTPEEVVAVEAAALLKLRKQ